MHPEDAWRDDFVAPETQQRAARLAMWLFLTADILLFTAVFVGYAAYRYSYAGVFHFASALLFPGLGLGQAVLLLTASLAGALALKLGQSDRGVWASLFLLLALGLVLGFLWIMGAQWFAHAEQGTLPGEWYAYIPLAETGGSLFFTLYFVLTGLHALHAGIGVVVLGFTAIRAAAGAYSSGYAVPLELVSMWQGYLAAVWLVIYATLYLGA